MLFVGETYAGLPMTTKLTAFLDLDPSYSLITSKFLLLILTFSDMTTSDTPLVTESVFELLVCALPGFDPLFVLPPGWH